MESIHLGKYRKHLAVTVGVMLMLLMVPLATAQENASPILSPDAEAKQKTLKREADEALRRLKRTMKKDGFYSGRVALNIWRSTATDAGTFDQTQYDEFKLQLYERSVSDSMRCFEEFFLEEDFHNANFCLQTWRMHAKELGTYDEEIYEALKKKLAEGRAAKASRKAGKK